MSTQPFKCQQRSHVLSHARFTQYRIHCTLQMQPFTDYLRVVIVAETFREGVMVYFQLSDLCWE